MQETAALLRKPEWLKVRLPGGEQHKKVWSTLGESRLHSICREARCPNMAECFQDKTATFLILGNICTRKCRYCRVASGVPAPPDPGEPARLAQAALALSLRYIVITSVARDDLDDGGAAHFAACIGELHRQIPGCRVEALIPDFRGDTEALARVIAAAPVVVNHNMEVVPSLFGKLRPQGNYRTSLELIGRIGEFSAKEVISKSGFMVGFGESHDDILKITADLAQVKCQRLTIGQYQQPTRSHWPVSKYYHPDEFAQFKEEALAMGFAHVEAGPRVRSSYHAAATMA